MVQTPGIMQGSRTDAAPDTPTVTVTPPSTTTIRLCHHPCQKKVTAAFDGGLFSLDGGVLLLAQGSSTLSTDAPLEQFVESGERGGISVLAER